MNEWMNERTLWNVVKRCETLRNVAKRCETLWNVVKRCETLWNVMKRCETFKKYADYNLPFIYKKIHILDIVNNL